MAPQPADNPALGAPDRVKQTLFSPLPDRWRPFSAFLGGAIILIPVTVFGGYGGNAWWFFVAFTVCAAILGIVWTLVRSSRRAEKLPS